MNIAEWIANAAEGIVVVAFCSALLTSRYKDKSVDWMIKVAAVILHTLVVSLINQYVGVETYELFWYVAECYLCAELIGQDKKYIKLMVACLNFSALTLASLATAIVVPFIADVSVGMTFETGNIVRYFALIFAKTVQAVIAWAIYMSIRHRTKDLQMTEWLGTTMMFLGSGLASGLMMAQLRIPEEIMKNRILFFIMCCILIANIIAFRMFTKLLQREKDEQQWKLLNEQIQGELRRMQEGTDRLEEIRGIRHDIRNQYITIYSMLQTQKYQEAERYFSDIIQETESALEDTYVINSGNPTLDMILNYYRNLCLQEGIQYECECQNKAWDFVKEYDLCSLMTNMVKNAYEAEIRQNAKEIQLKFREEKNYLVIQVKNRITASVLEQNAGLQTSKENKSEHGYGVKTIRRIAEKYDGFCEFRETEQYFSCEVWLKK